MRARASLSLILGLSILLGLLGGGHRAAADPRTVTLLPSAGLANAVAASAAAAPASPAVSTPDAVPAASANVPATDKPPARKPLYRRWWLWTIVGVVAAQGAVVGAIQATRSPPEFVPTIPFGRAVDGQ